MAKKSTYYGYLDILRIISAFAVIVIHMVTSTVFNATIPITPTQKTICSAVHSLMNFSVPTFIVITGFIFLGNDIVYSYKLMKKYISRIIIALIVFGSFYSILEQIFIARSFNCMMILQSFYDILSGDLWDHLWYLYTILGIYLIIPIIKPFFVTKNVTLIIIATALLIICNNVIPELNAYLGTKIVTVIPIYDHYVCYLFLGGLLAKLQLKKSYVHLSVICIFLSAILIILKYVNSIDFNTEYESLTICILTLSLFVLIRHLFRNYFSNRFIISVSKATWGIYLLHPLFLNIQLKLLHINPFQYFPIVTIPLNCLILFITSYYCVILLKNLSFVRRYVL